MHHRSRLVVAGSLFGLLLLASCSRSGGSAGSDTDSTSGGQARAASADFGTTKVACGKNATGKALTASDQGVTADSISLATVSDVGYSGRPGLNQELFDASDVFAKWCNDLGGINGRKIKVDQRDAALANYKPMMVESCTTDFAVVGGGGVFDGTGQDERLKCLLPNFPGYVVSAEARDADLTFQAVPNRTTVQNAGAIQWLKKKFPNSVDKVAVMTGAIPSLKLVSDQFKEEFGQKDMKVVDEQTYNPLGEATWTPFAQNLKQKGIKGLTFVGEPDNLAKLLQAMDSLDYTPDWVLLTANFYDQKLADLAGPALKNVYLILFNPSFDSNNPAMKKYLALFDQYKPDGKAKAVLGLNSFASWILFAQAASGCGADLTRKCLVENASKITEFDAGGLQVPGNPAEGKPSACFSLIAAADGKFKQVDLGEKDSIYNCAAGNIVTLKNDYGKGTTLASVGKSMSDLP